MVRIITQFYSVWIKDLPVFLFFLPMNLYYNAMVIFIYAKEVAKIDQYNIYPGTYILVYTCTSLIYHIDIKYNLFLFSNAVVP